MPTNQDFITGSEFARWMREESEFRDRLERRMATSAAAVQTGLDKIEGHLADINGRTRKNSEAIAVIERELEAIKSEDGAIEQSVDHIQKYGCGQLGNHETILRTLGWTTPKKAAVAGSLIGGGMLAWPAIQKIAEAVHAAIERWPQ